jgi:SAM-dependent methyltransferase
MPTHSEIFDTIYRLDLWHGGSGPGSSEELTRGYRNFLNYFMRANRIASVVDLGCGDWQIARHMNWTGIDYVGADVSELVLQTTQKFARDGVAFLRTDAVTDPLPAADLLIAKDVFQHWPNADILTFLTQLPKYRAALITNTWAPDGRARCNEDIHVGDWRPINLAMPPFNLPGVYVFSFQAFEVKWVYLWLRPDGASQSPLAH